MGRFFFLIVLAGIIFSVAETGSLRASLSADDQAPVVAFDYRLTQEITLELVSSFQLEDDYKPNEELPASEYESEMYRYLESRAHFIFESLGREDFLKMIRPCRNCGGLAARKGLDDTVVMSSRGFSALFENQRMSENRDLIVDFILTHELSHVLMNAYKAESPNGETINGLRRSGYVRMRELQKSRNELHAEIDVMAAVLMEHIGYSKEDILFVPVLFIEEAEAFARGEALSNFGSEERPLDQGWPSLIERYVGLIDEAFSVRGEIMKNSLETAAGAGTG